MSGKCQPIEIYSGPESGNEPLDGIAVAGDHVYFASPRPGLGVMQIPIAGSSTTPAPIWNEKPFVTSIAADATGVYVAGVDSDVDAGRSGLIEHVNPDTRQSETILTGDEYPSELALDQIHVYWKSGKSVIRRSQKPAGSASAVGQPVNELGYMTALSGLVFFQQTVGSLIVQRDAQSTVADHPLASNEAGVSSIAANRTHVFWSSTSTSKIRRVPIGGRDPIPLVDTGGLPTYMAADDDHVYWLTYGDRGALRAARVDTPGAAESLQSPIDLATDISFPRRLALDSRCVYVTTGGAGKIIRVAKP